MVPSIGVMPTACLHVHARHTIPRLNRALATHRAVAGVSTAVVTQLILALHIILGELVVAGACSPGCVLPKLLVACGGLRLPVGMYMAIAVTLMIYAHSASH